MTTNVVMQSNDRELFGTVIRQETKTGFLSLTDLQDAFESVRTQKGWGVKRFQELIARRENVERIFYILENQKLINSALSDFIESVENKGIATTLKAYGQYKTTGARTKKQIWCNPYIWILIALELSPEFYAKTVIWLTDKLILNRIEAGDLYKDLTYALKNKLCIPNDLYPTIPIALNKLVFGRHEAGIRNSGSTKQLNELKTLESNLAFAIENNYIVSYNGLMAKIKELQLNK